MKLVDPVERYLFLEGLFLKYGIDFRQYAEASLDRRFSYILGKYSTDNLLDLLKRALESEAFFKELLPHLTIGTTEFFRDPVFFKSLSENVFPVLSTYPSFNIWIAGCSSGQEILSLAILLKEKGLLHRSRIYATDVNPEALKKSKAAVYELDYLKDFARSYNLAGGEGVPTDYYITDYGLAKFQQDLLKTVVFAEHNLATDHVFCEAQLILCRNVMIYFNKELQERTFRIFTQSLSLRGFLALGSQETLRFSNLYSNYEVKDDLNKIYQLKPRSREGVGL